jgi:predicted RNA-binding Zn ribbon-like protein
VKLPDDIAGLDLVGSNLAVDYVNTADSASPDGPITDDHIHTYERLMAWAQRVALVEARDADRWLRRSRRQPREAAAVHRRALRLREALYDVLRATAEGRLPARDELRSVERAGRDALAHANLTLGPEGWVWVWDRNAEPGAFLWPIAHAGVELLTSEEIHLVKVCDGCRWLFMDRSRNHSRRWCTMSGCGNRAKARRFSARSRRNLLS